MPRPVPALAVAFVMRAEACRLVAYQDSAGVWTIGVGHVGYDVTCGMTITVDQAKAFLNADLAVAAARLARYVSEARILALSGNQYAALLSFVFNLGADASWTIWKLLNKGDLAGVPDQMKRFDKARDPKTGQLVAVPGLDHRRLAEVALWNTPDAIAAAAIVQAAPIAAPPSSTTRLADTPPTPAVVTPLRQSPRFLSSIATGVVTTGAAALPVIQGASDGVKQATDALSPYADQVHFAASALHILLPVAAGLAVATVATGYLQHLRAKSA